MKKLLLVFILFFLLSTPAWSDSISTLTDNFNDNSIDGTKWSATADGLQTVVETNQEIEITSTLVAGYGYLASVNTYDLTGSQASIKLVDAGNQALGSWDVILILYLDSNHSVRWIIENGTIYAQKNVNGNTTLASASYVAATFKYLKIRELSGTTYWDYSANGTSWTNFASTANPITITSLKVYLQAGTYAVELSTTTAKVDDFNILPSAIQPDFSSFNTGIDNGFNGGFDE